jgi:hypothetical protein
MFLKRRKYFKFHVYIFHPECINCHIILAVFKRNNDRSNQLIELLVPILTSHICGEQFFRLFPELLFSNCIYLKQQWDMTFHKFCCSYIIQMVLCMIGEMCSKFVGGKEWWEQLGCRFTDPDYWCSVFGTVHCVQLGCHCTPKIN